MDPSFLLAFPLLLALSTPCNACWCKTQHPQTYYCMSDIVIVADILGPGKNTVLKRNFTINTRKILKAPRNITQVHNLYTPIKWNDCGYEVRVPQQSQLTIAGYLRAEKMTFTACHMVHHWYRLSPEQQIGFEGAYGRGCQCQIKRCLLCSIGCPEPDFTECVWMEKDCKYDYWKENIAFRYMCAPSKSGRCEWTKIPLTAD